MVSEQALHEQARAWVTDNYRNADHLVRTEEWLLVLQPEASQALRLAALTHDMERAFPGPDSPQSRSNSIDPEYCQAHSERSARIVGEFLQAQGASEDLIADVVALIRVHEFGGWPEANLLQAADSLSFLEVNVPLFLRGIPADDDGSKRADVRLKFDWMYERIQLPTASELAEPLHASALERLDQYRPQ